MRLKLLSIYVGKVQGNNAFITGAQAITLSRVVRYNQMSSIEFTVTRPTAGKPASYTLNMNGQTLSSFVASWNSAHPSEPLTYTGSAPSSLIMPNGSKVTLLPQGTSGTNTLFKGKFDFINDDVTSNYLPATAAACAMRTYSQTLRDYCNAKADVPANLPPEGIHLQAVLAR